MVAMTHFPFFCCLAKHKEVLEMCVHCTVDFNWRYRNRLVKCICVVCTRNGKLSVCGVNSGAHNLIINKIDWALYMDLLGLHNFNTLFKVLKAFNFMRKCVIDFVHVKAMAKQKRRTKTMKTPKSIFTPK